MGRRKIEITPITHERNRSVTFLKRKNGLFKKAYELGVLCSVDVAVIIFEERSGNVKLHEYCSTDVDAMVQQHLRFDGEKESKHPADFNNKLAEVDPHEDDDEDDDGEGGRPSGGSGSGRSGRGGAGGSGSSRPSGSTGGAGSVGSGLRPSQNQGQSQSQSQTPHGGGGGAGMQRGIMTGVPGRLGAAGGGLGPGGLGGVGLDLDYRPTPLSLPHVPHHLSIPPHLSAAHLSHTGAGLPQHQHQLSPASAYPPPSLPVSLERHTPVSSAFSPSGALGFATPQQQLQQQQQQRHEQAAKRPRLDSGLGGGSGSAYPGGPSAYTIDDPHAHASYLNSTSQGGGGGGFFQSQSSLGFARAQGSRASIYGQGQGSPGPGSSQSQTQNPFASLLGTTGAGAGGSPASGSVSSTSPQSHSHHLSHSSQHQGHAGHGAQQFESLDWPVHNPSASSSNSASSARTPVGGGAAGGGGGDTSWLDFLSSAGPAANPAALGQSRPGSATSGGKRRRSASVKEEEEARGGANGDFPSLLGGGGKQGSRPGESDVRGGSDVTQTQTPPTDVNSWFP